jgi:hypothetical protein
LKHAIFVFDSFGKQKLGFDFSKSVFDVVLTRLSQNRMRVQGVTNATLVISDIAAPLKEKNHK